jgi:hypothetical protein
MISFGRFRMPGLVSAAVAAFSRVPALAAAFTIALAPSAGLGSEGQDPPPLPHTQTLAAYRGLVDNMMPQFDASMLSVPPGPNWMAGVTIGRVASAVQDTPPDTVAALGSEVIAYGGVKMIKLDYSTGYVRYTNRDRCFQNTSPCTAVSPSAAQSAFYSTLSVLGLPSAEVSETAVDLVMERSVLGEEPQPQEALCEIERLGTVSRKAANGYPVFECDARLAVSNAYERARLLIHWPQFLLEDGLLMRTRTDVVNDAAGLIMDAQMDSMTGLGTPVDLNIDIGYVRDETGFVPVAKVSFFDSSFREAGMIEYVPIAYNPQAGVGPRDGTSDLEFRARHDEMGHAASIEFRLPRAGTVRLSILDVSGREIAVLAEGAFTQGWHQIHWDLRDRDRRGVASGVYFALLTVEGAGATRKILVVR